MGQFLALLLALTTVQPLEARNARGVYAMAGTSAHWNCVDWYLTFAGASEINVAYLFKTFGLRFDCLAWTISQPKTKIIYLILTNYPGLKNGRLQPHEAMYGFTPQRFCKGLEDWDTETITRVQVNAAEAMLQVLPFLRPDQELWVHVDLESGCDLHQQGQYIRAVAPIFEKVPVSAVRFTSYGGLAPGAYYYEADHSNFDCGDDRRCIKSNDGTTVRDLKKFFAGKYALAIGWDALSNCNPDGSKWMFPALRKKCWDKKTSARFQPHMPRKASKPDPRPTPTPTPRLFPVDLHQVTPLEPLN